MPCLCSVHALPRFSFLSRLFPRLLARSRAPLVVVIGTARFEDCTPHLAILIGHPMYIESNIYQHIFDFERAYLYWHIVLIRYIHPFDQLLLIFLLTTYQRKFAKYLGKLRGGAYRKLNNKIVGPRKLILSFVKRHFSVKRTER
jgi:hypothetical protein